MVNSSNGGDLAQPQQPSPSQQQQPPQQQSNSQQWMMQQQQQQWMGMQYPAAAMAMMQQQMMMYPQHYMPYGNHFYAQQQPIQSQMQNLQNQGPGDEGRTIWVGDLQHWMDETYIHSCFAHTGEVLSVNIIRNKQTSQSEGYGFVVFYSRATAEKVLQGYNGTLMPNTDQPFHLNWAGFRAGDRKTEDSSDLSIFVGDLAADVTDTMLLETFSHRYPSVKGAKVVIDSNTGRSKGYGFVRFGDENERSKAMTEMNGEYCSSRPMRISVATPKKSSGYQRQSSQAVVVAAGHSSNGSVSQGYQPDNESNNTTVFVGGLGSDISEEDLRQSFSQFGEVVSVKIPVGKGCGFVRFANRENADDAIQNLNGAFIGNQTVRLSWGRNPGNKQWKGDASNQWNRGYHGGQGYGYAVPQNEDPSMYNTAAVTNGDS